MLATALRRRREFFERRSTGITHDVLDDAQLSVATGIEGRPSSALIDELFDFQDLLVPGFDRRHPVEGAFASDWLQYRQAIGAEATPPPPLIPGGVTLVHTPPAHAVYTPAVGRSSSIAS